MSSFHAARIIPWFCLGVLAIAAGCQARPAADAATSPAAASSAPPPVRVVVRPAERKTLVRKIEVPGQVEAYETAPLMAKVTGYVHRVAVDIGDRVRGPQPADGERPAAEGDLLLELDVPELERELALRKAAVAKARAVVAQSEAAIQLAKAGLASADSEAVEAGFAVEAQAALVAKWKSENDRIVQLAAAAAVTQKVADETGSQLQAAEAAQRQTQAKVQSAQARRDEAAATIQQAEAELATSQAEVEVALAEAARTETMLAFATLRAPFDGVVTARHVHPGHLVRVAGTEPLLVVSRIDPVRVVVQVPEGDALLVRLGSPAALRVPALPGADFTGQVTRTSEALDPGNRTLRIEIDIANPEGTLKPGTYLQAELEVANRKDVLALPRAAILTQDKRTFCLTVDQQGQVVQMPVQLGIQVGTEVEILSGLSGAEQIITANVGGFREGQMVQAVTSADSP
jgi:HlyD family secretion protein